MSTPKEEKQSIIERLDRAEQLRKDAIADLLTERKNILHKLQDVERLLAKYGHGPKPEPIAEPVKRQSGKMTVKDAIRKALADGVEHDIRSLVDKCSELIGKATNPQAIRMALLQLKKAKEIVNPSRGFYSVKKA